MNQWNCEEQGCAASAIGCGGAIGLRAIGWQFELGRKTEGFPHPPMIRCPMHRIDGNSGEVSARLLQHVIQSVDNLANACPICGTGTMVEDHEAFGLWDCGHLLKKKP